MWISDRLDDAIVRPWQSLDLDEYGLTVADVESAAYWVDDATNQTHRGHRGIGRALEHAGGLWRPVGWLIAHPPVGWIAQPAYRLIANNRHRLPGSTDACRVDVE